MTLLGTFRRKIMGFKVVVMRTSGYMALVNTFMILYLTLSKFKDSGVVSFDLGRWIIPIFVCMIVGIGIFGYFEMYVWGGYREETKINYELSPSHPDIQDIKRKVDEMYEKEMKKCTS